MICTLHSSSVVVDVLDDELVVGEAEPDVVAEGLDVVSLVVEDVTSVVVEESDVVEEVSTTDEVGRVGAAATGLSPTWESARPTICHVNTVVSTRAATQAAAIRQLIMW
jgi:hypothetical protein